MKKSRILSSISILLISCINLMANPDSLFNAGNKEYSSGNFEKAVSEYNAVAAQGFESAELYLNLGNSYYKLRNYPHSILAYERALLIDPGNEKVLHNLAKAQMYTVDKINQIPEFLITGWVNHIVMFFHSNTWAIISMVCFFMAAVGILFYFLSMTILMKRLGFYFGIILLIIALTGFYLSYRSRTLILSGNGAVVMSPTVTVKAEPNTGSNDLFIIHEGTKVYIMDVIDDWNEIKLADGKSGWLNNKDIEPI